MSKTLLEMADEEQQKAPGPEDYSTWETAMLYPCLASACWHGSLKVRRFCRPGFLEKLKDPNNPHGRELNHFRETVKAILEEFEWRGEADECFVQGYIIDDFVDTLRACGLLGDLGKVHTVRRWLFMKVLPPKEPYDVRRPEKLWLYDEETARVRREFGGTDEDGGGDNAGKDSA